VTSQVAVTSLDGKKLRTTLRDIVRSTQPQAIGLVTAFLSRPGVEALAEMVTGGSASATVRSVVGVSGAVTDPNAIVDLVNLGVDVRLANHQGGLFHPKMMVAGDRFLTSGKVGTPSCGYLGSANFTAGGFTHNVEVGLVTTSLPLCKDLAETFRMVWKLGVEATESRIEDYRARFAARQQRRSIDDLSFLEVAEGRYRESVIPPTYSRAAWAGLESFTGEYTLQVEFPKRAGEALAVLLGTRDGTVGIQCSDNIKRQMTYRYYADNGMYRLNVPNDMPGAQWARANRSGALLVSRHAEKGALSVEIISGDRLEEAAKRSRALGHWGRTSTREFGWY
jgi:PLD-like domain